MARKDYDRGYEDQRKGRYEPPGGKSWAEVIGGQLFGRSQADRDYHRGREGVKNKY